MSTQSVHSEPRYMRKINIMLSPRFSLSVLRRKLGRFLDSIKPIKPAKQDLDFRCQTPADPLDSWNEPCLKEIDNGRHTVKAGELVGEPLQTVGGTAETWNLNLPQTATRKPCFITGSEVSVRADYDDAVSKNIRPESAILPEVHWWHPSTAYVSQNSH
ncbi:hypothetical protein AOL_s00088g24 [Orbilia oligospora ATCC 24927]|uniref:Uncharacterized protein n=2 Tax=Orbilia oligospora TaxID=2813651 RepID=G1XHR1_ARTOA|nr:hypothetical protein AOL_s00088g24 [Orbilia oligospora ATCC 24927]EGX47309.1 hypothetical protein AOL_s00088g24 [Orbilia oligospora ATCC 24927]KAF3270572.1 hypothetical protein TWF970_010775 [Orbilia oligospora]